MNPPVGNEAVAALCSMRNPTGEIDVATILIGGTNRTGGNGCQILFDGGGGGGRVGFVDRLFFCFSRFCGKW